jgi:plasmid stabilization system protein ParE
MMNVLLLPKAIERLDEIYNYIRLCSELAAARIYNDILDEIAKLKLFPRMAPVEPILANCGKIFRSLVVMKHYKVVYYIEDEEDTIYIATVWDCRQNPDNLEKEISFFS